MTVSNCKNCGHGCHCSNGGSCSSCGCANCEHETDQESERLWDGGY